MWQVAQTLSNPLRCHKQLIEEALSDNEGDRTAVGPCSKCSVHKDDVLLWQLLYNENVCLVLFDAFLGNGNSAVSGKKTMDILYKAIRTYPSAAKHLFTTNSEKAPSIANINKLLFQMIAWGR